MEPIRILHVVTTMHRAGLETMLMNYYRKMDTSKIQFDFLTYRYEKSDYDDEILARGGKIYYFPPFSLKYILKNLRETKKFFSEHPEYKIVHSHIDALSCFPLMIAKKCAVPVRIAHSHCSGFDIDGKYPIRLIAREILRKVATDFFACSQEAACFMFGKRIYSKKKYIILKNAIDCDSFQYNEEIRSVVRKRLQIEDKFVVGHVGRFVDVKNHEKILGIFEAIRKYKHNSLLVLIGNGPLNLQIREMVKRKRLEGSVLFLGSRADVSDLMQGMDLFLLPSKYEGLGIALIEAQTAGVPCLASEQVVSKESAITDIIEYVNLKAEDDEWARQGIKISQRIRTGHKEEARKAGFAIDTEVDKLYQYYISRWKS